MTCDDKITVRQGIKLLDDCGYGIILITDENQKLMGIFTDSDFRKIVLNGSSLQQPICKVMNDSPVTLEKKDTNIKNIKLLMQRKDKIIWQLPILENGIVIDLVVESDLVSSKNIQPSYKKINQPVPVVIMAGGKGTRLDPITRIIPKPLVPIGDKTILEIIMDKLSKFGLDNFLISINYKGSMIKNFIEDLDTNYNIRYIEESQYLGTVGSLNLIRNDFNSSIIVTNCDVILDIDYGHFLKFHLKNNFDITLVGSVMHHTIPYGICNISESGELLSLKEKPEMDFLINSGMYLIDSKCLQFIPSNERFDMTDLIHAVKQDSKKIGVYPIRDGSWIDIGQLGEYKSLIERL